jgi:thymidylate synthase (FAD)
MTDVKFRSDMTVELVKSNVSDDDVVWAARVSTAGDRAAEGDLGTRKKGLIEFLLRERHMSPFEHGQMTFFVQAPIFVFREFHRHRTWSYNEESGRYKQLEPVFYEPPENRPLIQVGKAGAYDYVAGTDEQYAKVKDSILHSNNLAYDVYQDMLDNGIAREVARMVLPVNIYSSMYATVNPRNLMQFLSLRTKSEDAAVKSYPQLEIQMVADKIEALWAAEQPLVHEAWVKYGRR